MRRYPPQKPTLYDPYDKLIAPHVDRFPDVYLEDSDIERIREFSKKVADQKRKEGLYSRDGRGIEGRFFTGFCGEMAHQKFIKREVVDLSIGDSNQYVISDLKTLGLRCGVKTGKVGDFPKVPIQPQEPEVIILKVSDKHYKVCGVAFPDIIKEYSGDIDVDEVYMDERLRARNVKTCFFGHGYLTQFYNFRQLNELLYEEGFSDSI